MNKLFPDAAEFGMDRWVAGRGGRWREGPRGAGAHLRQGLPHPPGNPAPAQGLHRRLHQVSEGTLSLADLHSKISDVRSPVQFSSFSCNFRKNWSNIKLVLPDLVGTPPRKILDPPMFITCFWNFSWLVCRVVIHSTCHVWFWCFGEPTLGAQ